MRLKHSTLVISTIFTALIISTPVFAKDYDLNYKKSELLTKDSSEQLYKRIYDISEQMCDYEFEPPYAVKSKSMFDRCMRRTIKEWVKEISHPNLNEVAKQNLKHLRPVKLGKLPPFSQAGSVQNLSR